MSPTPKDASGELDRLTAELQTLAEEEATRAAELQATAPISREGIEKAKAELERVQKRMDARRREIEKVQGEVRAEIERRQNELRETMARTQSAIDTALEPIRKVMQGLEEGLTTMSLYLGRGEQIVTVREGEPADQLEPIVIRQMVLAMDEEAMVFAEDDGIDASRVEAFDEWLMADEAHVQQIVPEAKCVVALVPRWRERREDRRGMMGNPEDQLTHFLIRNGECLYRTSVEFHAGEVLVPRADDFIKFFRRERHGAEPEVIKPGSERYAKAMESADRRSRHYLRIGLILQGLIDRTEILHPLHPAGINMLSDPSLHSEKVRIIEDAEGGLESGLLAFKDWQAETNAQLRVGMRVVGAFDGDDFRHANEGSERSRYRYRYRVHPNTAENPPTGEPLQIEVVEGEDLIVRYARSDVYDPKLWVESKDRPGWGNYGGYRPSKQRASCKLHRSDKFILAYDLADVETMVRFLGDRRNRREYKELWPLMKSVWWAKREEEATEAPFRVMLAGVLARENGVSVAEAEAAIPDLVRWFKLANRWHRPLVDPEADEDPERAAHAVRLITAEHRRRVNDARRTVDEELVASIARLNPSYLVIARPRRGGYLLLEPEEPERNIYVRERLYGADGTLKHDKRWRLVGSRAERWTIVREGERWADWDRMAIPTEHITLPERDGLLGALVARLRDEEVPALAIFQRDPDAEFEAWTAERLAFDPEHPLRERPVEPKAEMRKVGWTRKANRPPQLAGYAHRGYAPRNQREDLLPWQGPNGDGVKGEMVYVDHPAVGRWMAERRLYGHARGFRDGAIMVRDAIIANLARDYDGDWPWTNYGYGRSAVLEKPLDAVLDIAIEQGLVHQGQLLSELFAVVVEREGVTGAWVPWVGRSGKANGKSWDEAAEAVFPEQLVGLRVDLTVQREPEDDEDEPDRCAYCGEEGEFEDGLRCKKCQEADEDAKLGDEDAAELGDRLRETVAQALAPKPEPVEPVARLDDDVDILPPE